MTRFGNGITKIFADGADLASIAKLAEQPWIRGFTTNPTLMRQAGISDYEEFAHQALAAISDARPISFEVFADDVEQMCEEALHIASWGRNVFVKIPVTDTLGRPTDRLVRYLVEEGVPVNVTAVMTLEQIERFAIALDTDTPAFLSVFAGRIADTGRDPLPIMETALERLRNHANVRLIWASPREVLNLVQAESIGCHVITVTPDLLKKMALLGKDLEEFSLETVRMFRRDAVAAGYSLVTPERCRLSIVA